MTRYLVTGAGGMLGQDLLAALDGRAVTALKRADLDVTDAPAVAEAVAGHDVVLNAAAWTDVDGAETAYEAALAVNGTGVAVLASACHATGARLVHVSTDYVFDGAGTSPYPEDAPTAPLNAYGRSKLAGEQAVLATLPTTGYVVRTAWLYGAAGRNFVKTMLRLAATRDFVDVVDDQAGQPTWSRDLARRLVELADADAPAGVYHGTASGQTTWHGLAQAVFTIAGLDPARVRRTTSAAYRTPAARPSYSVLGHDRWAAAGMAPLRDWHTMLTAALHDPAFAAVVSTTSGGAG
ncbi:dTDP-4-dehydrorhamnose reductase [Dactylosporangium aurantiacum]|uniref:dTDP-4-dehydrorhamnose reductase n=1 Tax=Dactylosporangium aurantiacum TaxID=35754 RepID=A0A9Q9IGM7_9ACTN|nr:dTDP-4-dehydrorhamnose reductase [Dactylosporangium aurantiacum]MDG6108922.1 dTDP-4-dehydrorhamnose reductase [Dactylosporangium aurantiacum]UWZ52215.1 dTDP-4-dehydrorhamnose reductase [Dactylosporangium aurantiacum]